LSKQQLYRRNISTYEHLPKLLSFDVAFLGSELRGLSLELLALFVGDSEGFPASLILALLLNLHRFHLSYVLLPNLLHLLRVIPSQHRQLCLRLLGVPRRLPTSQEGVRREEIVVLYLLWRPRRRRERAERWAKHANHAQNTTNVSIFTNSMRATWLKEL